MTNSSSFCCNIRHATYWLGITMKAIYHLMLCRYIMIFYLSVKINQRIWVYIFKNSLLNNNLTISILKNSWPKLPTWWAGNVNHMKHSLNKDNYNRTKPKKCHSESGLVIPNRNQFLLIFMLFIQGNFLQWSFLSSWRKVTQYQWYCSSFTLIVDI